MPVRPQTARMAVPIDLNRVHGVGTTFLRARCCFFHACLRALTMPSHLLVIVLMEAFCRNPFLFV